ASRPWYDRIEQETMIFAVKHEDDRQLVNRVAGTRADGRFTILTQERFKTDDLLLELVRRIAEQRQLTPNQARRRIDRFDCEPRSVGISELGQHQHRCRMFEEAV